MAGLKCIHCGHRVEAETLLAGDRLMLAHYDEAHPGRKYAELIDIEIDEAIASGRLPARLAWLDQRPKS
jgi:hypothetical protein